MSVVRLFIFSLASPYKSKLFNILDSFGLTLVALRLCGAQFKDVFNTIGIVYLVSFYITLVCCKIIVMSKYCCSQKLKVLFEQMYGAHRTALPTKTQTNDLEASLPHRLESQDSYRSLSEVNDQEETQSVQSHKSYPTYGSFQ